MSRCNKNSSGSLFPFVEVLKTFKKGDDKKFKSLQQEIGRKLGYFMLEMTKNIKGSTNVGFWSYLLEETLPFEIFTINLDNCEKKKLEPHIDELNKVLKKISFVGILVSNDRELYIHLYRKDNLDAAFCSRVLKNDKWLDIPMPNSNCHIFESFVNEVANMMEQVNISIRQERDNLSALLKVISDMQYSTDFLKHLYLIPLSGEFGRRKVIGVQAIHVNQPLDNKVLGIAALATSGIIMPYHIQEMDYLRYVAALRSAVAAIMARNMSHNIGSHVLWHMSREMEER